jgi:hypothetical protein
MKNYYFLIVSLISFNITMAQTNFYPTYDGTFNGTTYAQTFNFPTGAASYAGFANNNASIYPLSYPNGGQVSFKATVASDAQIKFVFEANPYPDTTPTVQTVAVDLLAANAAETLYTVAIPASATNTYNSAIMYVITSDVDVVMSETTIIQNAATAGVEDFAANAVKMFPNPAKGFVNFSSASNEVLDIAVYDMLGKQVVRAEAVQSQLNISSLNPGMYFVKMTQGSKVSTKKLLVN